MKPWYQYQTSLFSGVGDIGVDGKTGELPKFGYWPPSWILPNSAQIRTWAVFYIPKVVFKIGNDLKKKIGPLNVWKLLSTK